MYVEEKDRSWCSSNAANDHRAITIEVASDTTEPYAVNDKAFAALIDLVTDICQRNGIKKLVWSTNKEDRVNHKNGCNMTVHRDYANKSCPGTYLYERHGQIADEVNKRLGSYEESTAGTTDAQASSQTLTVVETLTNGSETITLRSYTATSGATNTIDLTDVWLKLIAGTHVLTITASDGAGGTATRKITFSRTVSRIAAARAFKTDSLVQKVFISLYPTERPADSTLYLEVTNNPFDASPVWEEITSKVNSLVHVFSNTTAANGYGLGYRFYILKGDEEIEVTQATIRFA